MVSTSHMRKRELRACARSSRDELPLEYRREQDAHIEQRILAHEAWTSALVVLIYLSQGSEVETRGLIQAAWNADKIVALPRCSTFQPVSTAVTSTALNSRVPRLAWVPVDSLAHLVTTQYGLDEPDPLMPELEASCITDTSLALVPGLVFDAFGYRLGYGGGYYDQFLSTFPGISLGLCYETQRVDSLKDVGACCAHDQPVQEVIS